MTIAVPPPDKEPPSPLAPPLPTDVLPHGADVPPPPAVDGKPVSLPIPEVPKP